MTAETKGAKEKSFNTVFNAIVGSEFQVEPETATSKTVQVQPFIYSLAYIIISKQQMQNLLH